MNIEAQGTKYEHPQIWSSWNFIQSNRCIYTSTFMWALIVDALRQKLLGGKPPHHGKVSFSRGGAAVMYTILLRITLSAKNKSPPSPSPPHFKAEFPKFHNSILFWPSTPLFYKFGRKPPPAPYNSIHPYNKAQ